jgi:hypothetical protein
MLRYSAPILTLLIALVVGACRDGDDGDEPRIVSDVIDAVLSGDPAQLEALIDYQEEPCARTPFAGPGAEPLCPPGEEDGFGVEGIWYLYCEGVFEPRDNVSLDDAVGKERQLFGAYEYSVFPVGAKYIVIFERNLGIVTNERGVIAVSYDLGCGLTAEQFGAREELGTPIAKH